MEPYRRAASEVLADLRTDAHRGLAASEAHSRLEQYGWNGLAVEKPAPGWRKFLAQFQDVLVILLLSSRVVILILTIVIGVVAGEVVAAMNADGVWQANVCEAGVMRDVEPHRCLVLPRLSLLSSKSKDRS